jgi:general secretion pathway protein N
MKWPSYRGVYEALLKGIAPVLLVAVAGFLLLGASGAFIATALLSTRDATEPVAQAQVLLGSSNPPDPNSPGPPQVGNPLWAFTLEQLAVTRERPIFSASRRPPPPADTAPRIESVASRPPPPSEPEKPPLSLIGTVAGERGCIGIFVEQATNKVVVLRTGEAHEGWMLRSAHAREATLEKNSGLAVLLFPPPGGQQSDAVPPAALAAALPPEQIGSGRRASRASARSR